MRIQHIRSTDMWLLCKGNRVLYRGKSSPWQSPRVLMAALKREQLALVA